MPYKLINISGGQIVCDLAVKGKTLRLNNKQIKTIKNTEITPHIKNLVAKGLILSEYVSAKSKVNNKAVQKENSVLKKEE